MENDKLKKNPVNTQSSSKTRNQYKKRQKKTLSRLFIYFKKENHRYQ